MLKDGTFYHDLGQDHFRKTAPEARAIQFAKQIEKLGYICTLVQATKEEVSV